MSFVDICGKICKIGWVFWMLLGGNSLVNCFQRGLMTKPHILSRQMVMNNDILEFGNRFDIVVKMPTKDFALAERFLKDPTELVGGLWDKKKYTLVDDGVFLLKMQEMSLPGIDSISPEMEVKFSNEDGTIFMESGRWNLAGTSKIIQDSRFMQSFKVKVKGQLDLRQESGKPVEAYGWVSFDVAGEKPGILKAAPDFLVESAINVIKDSSRDFATNDFSRKFLKSFRRYMIGALQGAEVEVEN